jgi:signal peptidase II
MQAVAPSRYLTFFVLATGGCLLDLATKHWIFGSLGMPGGQTKWLVPGVFGFQTSLNEGALFGVGQGSVPLLAVLSVAAAVAILYWLFFAGGARSLLITIALGSITAGILGNLYDRLGMPHLRWQFAVHGHALGDPVFAVRDWILVMLGSYPWPTFNIADSMLVCGAILMVWQAFRGDGPRKKEEPSHG